ncbi:MAG TPA: deoxyribonuclease IV [Chloroflexota bacterium]|nr:deoxyribonuclease IV [Chloroflexota bacterium]
MKFGAHVSIAGGLDRAYERAREITAECAQIFVAAPQRWLAAKHSPDAVAKYLELRESAGLGPTLIHGPYLINLASPDPALRQKSIDALVSQLEWSDRLGTLGVCFHVGSPLKESVEIGLERSAESLKAIFERATGTSPLLLETTAGGGNTIGGRFEDLGSLIESLGGNPRLQVCLDTCHIFAAGYPCVTREELDDTLARFDRAVGLDRLTALHLNDSEFAFGSHRDRHANIGEGQIGLEGFRAIINHPLLASLPGYLEVPGFNDEGPDLENLERLRGLSG